MTTIFKNKFLELCAYSKDSFGIVLDSGDENYPGCTLRLTGFGRWLSIRLPQIIKPFCWKVRAKYWDEATIARIGRNWYWEIDGRKFGIAINSGNHFNIYYGRQSDDSRHEKRWSCFLPWTEWEHVRKSGYGKNGEWLFDEPKGGYGKAYDECKALEASQYVARFQFADYDGEVIIATCRIDESEYRKGVGYFRWLRFFVRNRIYRGMRIEFSSEVGRKKGSWKGGTTGHGIEMQPGELHEAAFKRYCVEQKLSYIGPVTEPAAQ